MQYVIISKRTSTIRRRSRGAEKFLEVKQAYFNSMQNFLRQVAGLIQRDENDVRLALYNLKQAKAGLPKMHKFFDGIELDEEIASKHTNLCRQESQKNIGNLYVLSVLFAA